MSTTTKLAARERARNTQKAQADAQQRRDALAVFWKLVAAEHARTDSGIDVELAEQALAVLRRTSADVRAAAQRVKDLAGCRAVDLEKAEADWHDAYYAKSPALAAKHEEARIAFLQRLHLVEAEHIQGVAGRALESARTSHRAAHEIAAELRADGATDEALPELVGFGLQQKAPEEPEPPSPYGRETAGR